MPELRLDGAHRGFGVALTLLSISSFAFMQVFASMNTDSISITEQTFFRNLIGLFLVGGVMLIERRRGKSVQYENWRKYALHMTGRSLFGLFGVIALFYAVRHAHKADVSIVSNSYVFITPLISSFMFGERLTKVYFAAILIAFSGVLIAANPTFGSESLPMLAAFACAMLSCGAYILLSYFSGRVDPLAVILHFCALSTVAAAPFAIIGMSVPSGHDLFCLFMIGVCAAVGQITMTYSYRMLPAGEISVYNQLSIPVNATLGYVFLGEVPGGRTLIGAAAVITAGTMLFISKRNGKSK